MTGYAEYKYPLYKKAFECFEKSEDSDLQKNYEDSARKMRTGSPITASTWP